MAPHSKKSQDTIFIVMYVSIALQLTFVDVLMTGIRHMLIIIPSAEITAKYLRLLFSALLRTNKYAHETFRRDAIRLARMDLHEAFFLTTIHREVRTQHSMILVACALGGYRYIAYFFQASLQCLHRTGLAASVSKLHGNVIPSKLSVLRATCLPCQQRLGATRSFLRASVTPNQVC